MAAACSSMFGTQLRPATAARAASRPATSRSVVCMAKKTGRDVITLECTEQRSGDAKGSAGMSRYTTQKNKKNTPDRLELMKYNKYLKRRTLHREIKK